MCAFLFDSSTSPKNLKLQDGMEEYRPLLGKWLLEMAIMLKWYQTKHRRIPELFDEEEFCYITGISVGQDDDCSIFKNENNLETQQRLTAAQSKKILQSQLKKIRKKEVDSKAPLFRNIDMLAELVGLNSADKMILTFTAAMNLFPSFRIALSARCIRASNQLLLQILSQLSGLPENAFRTAIGDDGILVKTGMIKVGRGSRDLEEKLDLLDALSAALLIPHAHADELVGHFLKKASPPTLNLNNFPHLVSDTATLLPYLENSLNQKIEGVNILLYGKAGVGKTEYVKALAVELNLDLYEIAFADNFGDQIKGELRLRSYSLCQFLLARTNKSLLLFDEIEDVFPSDGSAFLRMLFGGKGNGGDSNSKAFINRTLENNPVPAIWISNHIDQIDPAYLRRFDYSVSFPIPPASVRLTIAQHHLSCFDPPEGFLERIAANEETTPSQFDRAAKVARVASNGDPSRAIQLIERVLDKSATILNQKKMPSRNVTRTKYNLEYLNTDTNISTIVDGLKRRPRGTFCFYGSSGTGKTELARYISDETGKQILLKRASDIMDMYVGQTEKNIASMFSDARQQEKILVLDEADSFLSNRQDAQRSYEKSQINELLTQMEAFEGIFICTTNLMEKLDPACLRRFAFKVRFDPLLPEQRWNMFKHELERLGGNLEDDLSYKSDVVSLEKLTVGDFATAARQFELWDTPATAAKLFDTIQRECQAKGGVARRIGF